MSSAAQSISGHAERGGTTWRREGEDQPLLGRPNYAAAGATPAPRKPKATPKRAGKGAKLPTRKARKGDGKNGTVKSRAAIKCGHRGCGQVFATTAEAAEHAATHTAQ